MNRAMEIKTRVFHLLWRLSWKLRAMRKRGLQVGDLFPDFSLVDLQGRRHRMSDAFPKKCAVLWFTNLCEDCRSKIPLLEELQREAGDRAQILAVSLLGDDRTLPVEVAKSCDFPILMDPGDIVGRQLGLPHPAGACPLHNLFIVNKRGRIMFRHHLSAVKADALKMAWTRAVQD